MGRKVRVEDLFTLSFVSDPQISPDGERVAFVVTTIDQKSLEYVSRIYMASTDGRQPARQFTSGPKSDRHPRWSPDGKMLAFLSERDKDKKAQIYVMDVAGGEARRVTDQDGGVSGFDWAPDSQGFVYQARVLDDTGPDADFLREWYAREKNGDTGKGSGDKPPLPEVRVFDRIRYKANGIGQWDGRRSQIFVISLEGGAARQITSGPYDHTSPRWSPDGKWIAFVADRDPEADYRTVSDIWVVPPTGGEPRRLTASLGPSHNPVFSPNGRYIAYLGHTNPEPAGMSSNTRVWIVDVNQGEPRLLTADFDANAGHSVGSDMRSEAGPVGPFWAPDGRSIYFLSTIGPSTHVHRVTVPGQGTGEVTQVTAGERDIFGFTLAARTGDMALAVTNPLLPGDVFFLPADGVQERRLSAVNDNWLAELDLSRPEPFNFTGADGWSIQGFIMKPPGFEEGRRYPAVLEVHGGPHSAYGHAFFLEFQLLAAAGFVVLYTNPRGSDGYGEAFRAAVINDWGGKDYEDLMAGVDALCRLPFIDTERLGVLGGSYGGFMTNWIVGHTNRFRAAVTQRSISNLVSMFGTSDIGYFFNVHHLSGALPWSDPKVYEYRSPLTYVANVTTPIMIIHSDQDLRCPFEQAEQFFVALRQLRKTARLVRFAGENHELSRSGKPKNRAERLRQILSWMTVYLGEGSSAEGRSDGAR